MFAWSGLRTRRSAGAGLVTVTGHILMLVWPDGGVGQLGAPLVSG
jgi:hypothetical protein